MARVSRSSGYMANYFRWFGVPEAPVRHPVLRHARLADQDLHGQPAGFGCPLSVAGILVLVVISREVLPRLGAAVRRNRVATWTAGLVFLAFWLPYNNGLRAGTVRRAGRAAHLVSRSNARSRPAAPAAAVAVIVAAFTLTAGPSGLICLGALIAGAAPVTGDHRAAAEVGGLCLAVLGRSWPRARWC